MHVICNKLAKLGHMLLVNSNTCVIGNRIWEFNGVITFYLSGPEHAESSIQCHSDFEGLYLEKELRLCVTIKHL